jgi:hypothetical protein
VGVHGPTHRRAHLRTPCASRLRIEPNHPCLDDDPSRSEAACGISLPPSVRPLPRKRGDDLRASTSRVEPACSSSFPAGARSRSRAYPTRIAACLADRDLDLFQKRPVRGLTRVPRLRDRPGLTRKFSLSSLAMTRRLAWESARTRAPEDRSRQIASTRMMANKERNSSLTHITSAIARNIEIKE